MSRENLFVVFARGYRWQKIVINGTIKEWESMWILFQVNLCSVQLTNIVPKLSGQDSQNYLKQTTLS